MKKLHKNCTTKKLLEYGFKRYGTLFIYNKPVYFYKKEPVIELVITVELSDNTNYVSIDVNSNGGMYVPYYNDEYSKNDIVLKK